MGEYFKLVNHSRREKIDPLLIESSLGGKRREFFTGDVSLIVFDLLLGRWSDDSISIIGESHPDYDLFEKFTDISKEMEAKLNEAK